MCLVVDRADTDICLPKLVKKRTGGGEFRGLPFLILDIFSGKKRALPRRETSIWQVLQTEEKAKRIIQLVES
jgi:hypothetical protein